jgi:hypothetical protein
MFRETIAARFKGTAHINSGDNILFHLFFHLCTEKGGEK